MNIESWCTCLDYRETGTHGRDIDGVECEVLQVGRLLVQARNDALDEAARVAGDYPTCVDYDSYGAQCNMRHGIATTIRGMKS